MKTKLTLLLFASLAIGCTTDNEEPNCNCGTIIKKTYAPPFASAPDFTVLQVKNDCTGEIKTVAVDGNQGELNGKWCN